MAYDTIIQTGHFTSNGLSKTLKLRSDVDRLVLENITEWAATNNGAGVRYTWYRELGNNILREYHPAADHTAAFDYVESAISLIDSGSQTLGSAYAVTAGTNATQPVYDTSTTTNLEVGSIVRVTGSDQTNINGLDFSIDTIVGGTSFRLANTLATAPGVTAGANGVYRLVAQNLDSYKLFKPAHRIIADISNAASAVVTTLVDHDYFIGQKVKFNVNSLFGMTQMDGLIGVVTAITDSTFTVDINSTAFTAFNFPVYTVPPMTYATVTPIGDGKSAYSALTPSKFYNNGFVGLVLYPGTTKPAGSADDVIKWTAYKGASIIS